MKRSPIVIFFLFVQLLSSQVQDKVNFVRGRIAVYPRSHEKKIDGNVNYTFEILEDVDSVFLDAINMKFDGLELNGRTVEMVNDGKRLTLRKDFKQGDFYNLKFDFEAFPKQTVYFLGWEDDNPSNNQIWTQGQGKYTSHWLPSFDDMSEKVEFDITIIFDKEYEVITNGKLKDVRYKDDVREWRFKMQKPMSSYLVGFAIGHFDKKTIHSNSGVPIELYFEPRDSLKVEPTYRYTQGIFDFLENEIGVSYPWQNYKQVPVQDFLYAGMENTGATIFSNTFVVDSVAFLDKNYVNVNAHELAHQWFGNLVTEQSGAHHWLHEGFATYYAYLAEKDIFGEDYFYWHLLETANALDNFSGEGNGEALTNSGAGSLTFYEKGAWALVMLREMVGDASFRKGIQDYLSAYAYKNATISNFMQEMEKTSGLKLSDFENMWLQESEFPMGEANAFLIAKSSSIKSYFDIKMKIDDKLDSTGDVLEGEWDRMDSDFLKHQLILDYGDKLSTQFIQKVLRTENVKVRQAVALSLQHVPDEIKTDFEGLLQDKSYITVETALYRLWTDFPEYQKTYLDQTDRIIGLPNKNVRMLWLTLALITQGYNIQSKPEYFKELSDYTSSEHHFETRLLAFQYLKNIGGFNDATLKNLIEACGHHVWHFKKSCGKILQDFLKGEGSMARIEALYPSLGLEEQQYLDKTLGK